MKSLITCPILPGLTTFGFFSKDIIPAPACREYSYHPSASNDAISSDLDFHLSQKIMTQLKEKIIYIDPTFTESYKKFLFKRFHKAWMNAREKSEFIKKSLDYFLTTNTAIIIDPSFDPVAAAKFQTIYNFARFYTFYFGLPHRLAATNLEDLIIHEIGFHAVFTHLFTYDTLRNNGTPENMIAPSVYNLILHHNYDTAAPYSPYDPEAKEKYRNALKEDKIRLNNLSKALKINEKDRTTEQKQMVENFCSVLDSSYIKEIPLSIEQFEQLANQYPEINSVGSIVNLHPANIRLFENTLNFRVTEAEILSIRNFNMQNGHTVILDVNVITTPEQHAQLMLESINDTLNIYSTSEPQHDSEVVAHLYENFSENILHEALPQFTQFVENEVEQRLEEYYEDNMVPEYAETEFKFSSI